MAPTTLRPRLLELIHRETRRRGRIFMKLNLRESEDTSRRVKAALIYLADVHPADHAQS